MKRIANCSTLGRSRTGAQPFSSAGSHIGILNDYVRIPYANGSSFASQLLYRHLRRLGSTVTIIGARDPDTSTAELPDTYECLPSLPLRSHPGVYIAMPDRNALQRLASLGIDLILGQTASQLLQAGLWLRLLHRTPLLCVNTIHLPSVYEAILPESLPETSLLHRAFRQHVVPWLTRETVRLYNQGDGLVVLSSGLKRYWEDLGVSVPVTVIPRPIEPDIFDLPASHDPIPREFSRDHRLLCVCRHTREKSLDRLLGIFARFIAPVSSRATLTLVGDGPEHASLKELAVRLGVGNRVHFTGERPLTEIPNYYRAADVFVYTSLSETYGQVISEAMWSGLPVVALDDAKGVRDQIRDGETGFLIPSTMDAGNEDFRFASAVLTLLRDRDLLTRLSQQAAAGARLRCAPELAIERHLAAFAQARHHCLETYRAPADPSRSERELLRRWRNYHGLLALTGLMRRPHTMELAGRRPPRWNDSWSYPSAAAEAE